MSWNDKLFGKALDIAKTTATPLRVMAGPGTGKSYAMMCRLMRLLEEGANPRRILVGTFTRTAADTLVKEVRGLGVDGCETIVVGTLHSYCFGILIKRDVLKQTKRVARPLVTFNDRGILRFEATPLLADLGQEELFGNKRDRIKSLRAYEAAFARLQSDEPGHPHGAIDRLFSEHLLSWLQFHEAMLVGEIVPVALGYLQTSPLAHERSAFDHVLVDEYQDLNKAEQELVRLLVGAGSYSIFGDEDQSIYSFRYAHPEGIIQFKETHPSTEDQTLDECWRCPKRVVAMANQLILNNHTANPGPRLCPMVDKPEGEVYLVQWPDLASEAQGIAEFARLLIHNRGYKPAEILVLCPRRLIGYGLRQAMNEAGVPPHSFFHEEALEADEAQRAFTLLTLLANRDDRVALRFWLGQGSGTWNSRGYRNLREFCEKRGLSPWQALEALDSGLEKLPHTGKLQKRFKELLTLLAELQPMSVPEVVDRLFPDGQDWAEELRDAALLGGLDGFDVNKLLNRLRYRVTQPELPEAGEVAQLMSLHKSKGLTRKVVVVAGCMQGLVPTFGKDMTPAEQEAVHREQRRLFYVAMTRCKEVLVLSWVLAVERNLALNMGVEVSSERGVLSYPIPSEFLQELRPAAPAPVQGAEFLRRVRASAT
jgi:DNA helicase II / ATP-dependent DNA helicase PcrA